MTGKSDADGRKPNAFTRFSHLLHTSAAAGYYRFGEFVSSHPLVFIIVPFAIGLACLAGFSSFDIESDPEKLYTPQNSIGFEQRVIVEDIFGFDDRRNNIYFEPSQGDNVLDKQDLLELQTAYEIIKSVNFTYKPGTDKEEFKTLDNGCVASSTGVCDFVSILDVWNYDRAVLEADADPLATINTAFSSNATDRLGRPLSAESILGGIERTQSGLISAAYSTRFNYVMINNVVDLEGESDDDPATRRWELEVTDALFDANFQNVDVFPYQLGDRDDASGDAITADVGLLPVGYILLIGYAMFILSRRNAVASYSGMALISVLAIGLAIAASFAFTSAIGVQFSLAIQSLAFLLLGLGIDDTFVIMASFRATPRELSTRERIGRALSSAGVSITVTSVTDMCAFFSGAATSLPAIESFCIYAAVGVFFDFALQITFFVASLYFYGEREKAQRADVLVCWKPSNPDKKSCSEEEFDATQDTALQKFMGTHLPRVLLHPAGKVITLLVAAALAGVALWGATEVRFDFEIDYFIPAGHYTERATQLRDKYYSGRNQVFSVYMQNIDYPALQPELDELTTLLNQNNFVIGCENWWANFKTFARTEKNVTGLIPAASFYPWLDEFLNTTAGLPFDERIIWTDNTMSELEGTEIVCQFVDLSTGQSKVDAMRSVRDVAEEPEGLEAFAYSFFFLFWDGLAVIRWETLRNIIIAGAVVFALTLVLLANLRASLTVFFMLVLTDINVLGVLYYADYEFNSVTAVNLVIAVGLAIDSSVHMTHAFMIAQGTRNERAAKALHVMGESVFNGTFSTFLALLPLAFAKSYIFQVYFALLVSIVGFGIFHGALVLPVVLSLIGPPAYPPVEVGGHVVNIEMTTEGQGRAEQTKPASATVTAQV